MRVAARPPSEASRSKRIKVIVILIFVALFVLGFVANMNFGLSIFQSSGQDFSAVPRIPVDPSILRTGYSTFSEHAAKHQFKLVEGIHYDAPFALSTVSTFDNLYNVPKPWIFDYMAGSESIAIPYTILAYAPRIHHFASFVTPEEAQAVIDVAARKLGRSQVAVHKGSTDSSTQEIRTSYQTWLRHSDPAIAPIAQRMCSVMNMDCNIAEQVMVLRYEKGQRYVHHVDFFDPQWYGKQETNRVATFFIYLSGKGGRDSGGATIFPRANGAGHPADPRDCGVGLRVYPVAGSAVVFYDLRRDGSVDDFSLHGGCPPTDDFVKWAAVMWLRVPVPADRQARYGHRANGTLAK